MQKALFDNGIVWNGDALAVLRELPGESVDAVVTDPPYSSGGLHVGARQIDPARKYQKTGTMKVYPAMLGDLKDQRSFIMWSSLWLSECWRVARPSAPVLVFSDWRQIPAMTDAIQAAGFVWRGIVVWHKPTARPMRGTFRRDAEFVICAAKAPAKAFTTRCLPGMFSFRVVPGDKVHLAGKPIDLLIELMAVTPEKGTVLDPFLGGGTTALACIKTGRRFVGVELSPEYYRVAGDRIRAAQGVGQTVQ